jgi:hypothetical protein
MAHHLASLVGSFLLSPLVAAAASPQWVSVDGSRPAAVLVDRSTITERNGLVSAWALRVYSDEISLGSDPLTGQRLHPHRSAKVRYLADCQSGTLGMAAWRLYSGNLADGELVWADSYFDKDSLAKANSAEEQAVLSNACIANAARR